MKRISTLQNEHVAAIYKIARLIDNGAPENEIEAARIERDAASNAIRKTLPNYDKGYT